MNYQQRGLKNVFMPHSKFKTITLNFDSTDRLNPNDPTELSQFNCMLPRGITKPLFLSLWTASIPKSWYDIQSTNNTIYYNYGAGTQQQITVPVGNYSAVTLASTMETLFQAQHSDIDVTFSQTSGMFTWSSDSQLRFIFGNPPLEDAMTKEIGFQNTYSDVLSIGSGSNWSLTSSYIIDLNFTKRLKVFTDLIDGAHFDSKFNGMANLLVTIPVIVGSYQTNNFENDHAESFQSSVTNLQNQFRVRLCDDNNNPINLQYVNWSFTIVANYEDN